MCVARRKASVCKECVKFPGTSRDADELGFWQRPDLLNRTSQLRGKQQTERGLNTVWTSQGMPDRGACCSSVSSSTASILQILLSVHRAAVALRTPERFAKAFDEHMLRIMYFASLAQLLVDGPDSLRAVDGELVGDGEVQGEVKKRIHLAAFRREFLFDGVIRVLQQRVVFRVVRDEVGGDRFGAVEDFACAMFAPGFAEKEANLVT